MDSSINNSSDSDTEYLLTNKRSKKKKANKGKAFAFLFIGGLTFLYCVAELAAALYLSSLTLLSDGFHNLSDVVSLCIAYWAQAAAQRDLSKEMSYGWARTEILGGLTNGCFLLSLSLYVLLEAIPKLIWPETSEQLRAADGGYLFVIIASSGFVINLVGTLVFAAVGLSHGHSHSHGHGHGHGHGHKDKNTSLKDPLVDENSENEHEHEHEHSSEKKKKEHKHKKEGHKHKHEKGHKHDHEHGHKKSKLSSMDVNTFAVFIHFLGDAVSSIFVLATGLLLHFFKGEWTKYIDTVASLLIILLIIATTIPLVKRCSMILLQSVPSEIDLDKVRSKTSVVDGVVSVHDLHVWQLVDGMIIASVHLMIEEGTDVGNVVYQVKQIFHSFGIHSSAIQPEFVRLPLKKEDYCAQNCVEECEADWCCKKGAEKTKDNLEEHFSTFSDDPPV